MKLAYLTIHPINPEGAPISRVLDSPEWVKSFVMSEHVDRANIQLNRILRLKP